jgi:D-lactate dehydrogenase
LAGSFTGVGEGGRFGYVQAVLDVCFYEAFEEEAAEIKACLPADIRAEFRPETIQEFRSKTPPARVVSIRTQSVVPLAWAENMSAILSRSTGYDHLEAYYLQASRKLAYGYLPLYCARAVAEQAVLMGWALARRLPRQRQQMATFNRDGLTGMELEGKCMAVVGVGNIGSEIIKLGEALGMKAVGVDLVKRHDFVTYQGVNEAVPQADIIVAAMNLTTDNKGYFDEAFFKLCKPGAIFVNIARGELVSSVVLLKALEAGGLGGVGLDVYEDERAMAVALRAGRKTAGEEAEATWGLYRRPNVILSPHNAFNTVESVHRKAEQSVAQVKQFLETGEFIWKAPFV